jgi:Glycosyltransferase family 87
MTVVEPVGSVRWKYLVVAAVALAFALKVAVALNTYGSNDVITWERHLAKIKDDGGAAWYRDGADIHGPDGRRLGVQSANHPPLVIHMLLAWDCLAHLTGLPFRFWLRLTSSLADIGSLILVSFCLIGAGMPVQPGAMLLIALSPVSIMVSAFHGNTDPVMMFFVLLSIWVVQSEGSAWVSGAAIGVALSIKIVPIIFVPAFLLYLPAMRRRIEFTVATAAVFMGTSLPYLTQDPALLVQRIFGYSSTPAAWGVSQMGFVFLPKEVYGLYMAVGKAIAVLIILLTSFWMNRGDRNPALFLQCGCIAFLFLFFTPGFAVQYLAWLVPWGFNLSSKRVLSYYATSAAFLFGCYTWWSGGFPWFFANSFERRESFWWGFLVFSLGLMCWVSVGAVAHETLRALAAWKTRFSAVSRVP